MYVVLRLLGRGIEADPEGAFHDFQAGAAAGDPFAIFNLGGWDSVAQGPLHFWKLLGTRLPQSHV
jgi:hypothetical protein